ncbi:BZ3500_MvSof-1268-A1-R1_Chr2-2g04753 [Microbotryum saponariae]|uniref:BZ3500_MvSof-1268-A1-R1_Chr2-2g04753 protein n=1 Tax=Microbotryum saponariae TaxID=289078 RepID=A0A2X0LUI8_9BASI|nr:BZ3500_MvSof-1268-A1-R1_Chr2-2g04753 [Microbotryum saponariae]SDA00075.1 BZ3501_MvSof-1269-A2-R1_Chr2-2g04427 [Microbotryum saponariae]
MSTVLSGYEAVYKLHRCAWKLAARTDVRTGRSNIDGSGPLQWGAAAHLRWLDGTSAVKNLWRIVRERCIRSVFSVAAGRRPFELDAPVRGLGARVGRVGLNDFAPGTIGSCLLPSSGAHLVTSNRTTMQSLMPDWHVGETRYTQSKSTKSSVYTLTHPTENIYICSCPAWKFSPGRRVAKTCKHLREVLGSDFETQRTGVAETLAQAEKRKAEAAKSARLYAAVPMASSSSTPSGPATQDAASSASQPGSDPDGDPPKKVRKTRAKSTTASNATTKIAAPPVDVDNALETGRSEPGPRPLLLAHKFNGEKMDPTGYWMSEKLDGVRAYWDGRGAMWSRNAKQFVGVPQSFLDKLPRGVSLDGEFWLGRDRFDEISGLVRRIEPDEEDWKPIKFMIFDIPSLLHLKFEDRHRALASFASPDGPIAVVAHKECLSLDHLYEELERVQAGAGEGLMLRAPGSKYEGRRHKSLLKVKSFDDAEARVIGHVVGTGKYIGVTGSLICETESGQRFSVGSGLSDAQRSDPPPIGSIITYRFQNLTTSRIPRFPTYQGIRADMDEPKDAFDPAMVVPEEPQIVVPKFEEGGSGGAVPSGSGKVQNED